MLSEDRRQIDEIDKQIAILLEKRYGYVSDIKKIKRAKGISVLDGQREDDVLKKVREEINLKEYEEPIIKTFESIMSISRDYQASIEDDI